MQKVFSHLKETFKLEQNEDDARSNVHTTSSSMSNFLVLDAYHTAATSFKKLESLVRVDKETTAEDVIEEISNFVEKTSDTKKSKSS